jgi:hypothetical protein
VLRKIARNLPRRIQVQPPAWERPQVTMGRVIRYVALEEHHGVPPLRERAAQPAPQCGVSVAPGRTDCETEHDQLHWGVITRRCKPTATRH